MNKPKSSKRRVASSRGRRKSIGSSESAASVIPPRSETKQARVVGLLSSPAGVTIAAITAATGWQPHSVRGFFAGVVRKKLKLNLVSEPSDKGRVYRVAQRKRSSSAGVSKSAKNV